MKSVYVLFDDGEQILLPLHPEIPEYDQVYDAAHLMGYRPIDVVGWRPVPGTNHVVQIAA